MFKRVKYILLTVFLTTFIACNKTEPPTSTIRTFNYSYLSDIDGNQYKALKIGSQTWMVENLRVTHLNDGTPIAKLDSTPAWDTINIPAFCWYEFDSLKYAKLYGAYYNGFASENNLLSPKGWHIPSDSEWTVLENYLIANGYNYNGLSYGNNFAKSMAASSGWLYAEGEGVVGNTDFEANRNASGFSAVPAGYRQHFAFNPNYFYAKSTQAYFWSSSKSSRDSLAWGRSFAYGRSMSNTLSSLQKLDFFYYNGIAVRCVKD